MTEILNVFRLPNMPVLCMPFSRHDLHVYTDRGKLPAWGSTPIYPPGPYTHWRFHFEVNAIRRLRDSRGRTWVEVLLRGLYNRDNAAISTWIHLTGETVKSASCWSCERRWPSHIKQRWGKMVWYVKDAEDLSLLGFCRDKKQGLSKIKNMLPFLHL